jgi:type II pantothenate kinase
MEDWWDCLVSFTAGAAVVSIVWFWQNWSDQFLQLDDFDNVSWVEPWSVRSSFKMTVEDIWTNQIGELPGTSRVARSHWPWETIRRRVFPETVEDDDLSMSDCNDNDNDNANDNYNDVNADDVDDDCTDPKSKNICIGSIFGLDVGGTLAKLVYFEQKSSDYEPLTGFSSRERQYSVAASAQAVLLARRGYSKENTTTNHRRHPHQRPSGHTTRRRSLSLGCMGRFKDIRKEQEEQQQQQQGQQRPNLQHSEASDFDLRKLYELRQESVPDDLNQYMSSVHFESKSPTKNNVQPPPKDKEAEKTSSTKTNDDIQSSMKKSRSMFDLSQSQKKAEALDRFYNFARRLDSYQDSVRDHKLSFYSRELGGEFHFIHFETRWMKHAMDLIRYNDMHLHIAEMGATGGGAHKYAKDWERVLGIKMDKQDELDSLVAGMQYVLSTVVGECYTFRPRKKGRQRSSSTSSENTEHVGAPLGDSFSESEDSSAEVPPPTEGGEGEKEEKVDEWWWSRKVQRDAISYSSSYPYLLVTIGTGVSILRVDGPRQHERISGSTIGGGTYWGLIRLLTDVEDFDDCMRLAEKGDPAKVDMMVGDIYGENSDALEKLGLPSNIVASSFGKLVAKQDPAEGLKQEDLARALLLMVTNNIGQVAYLNAKLHKTPRIYFVGNFLRSNKISQRRLSYAIDYWSKGEMEALFLEHEGYFGSLGAFLMSQNIAQDDEGFFQWGKDTAPPPPTEPIPEVSSSHSLLNHHHRRMKTCGS